MFPVQEHQAPKQCTADVSLATDTVLQHRISYHCHHPARTPDLCNRTDKSCYSAYYCKRTEITVQQHFPSPQHPFCRSPRVLCPYSFPAGSLNGRQTDKLLYHCCKLNARSAGTDLTREKERARVISRCLLHSYIPVSSRKFSKTDIPSTLAQLQIKNKSQTLSFSLIPEVPSRWPRCLALGPQAQCRQGTRPGTRTAQPPQAGAPRLASPRMSSPSSSAHAP